MSVIPFPLVRRKKLIAQLQRARSDKEREFALRRTVLAMERAGIPPEVIAAQVRAVTIAACHRAWRYVPEGAA